MRIPPEAPTWLTSGLAVAALGLLAACSGSTDDASASPNPAKVGEQTTFHAVSPLTGLPLPGEAPDHPVVAVKIDNSASSAPQLGLGSAGLVVEELVEGGITRLAVFYYEEAPGTVGPVRSMRATDIGIVQPLDAVLVASGGAPVTVRRVRGADIRTVTEGGTGFFRESSRSAPYNLFMRLKELVRSLEGDGEVRNALPFGTDELPRGTKATGLTASFSPSSTTSFAYRDGRYLNTDSLAAEGDRFTAETVLVLRVPVGDAGYRDPAGNPVPETRLTGQGQAMIFHGGRLVRGSWSKSGLGSDLRLAQGDRALRLPPGKVWIELVPADGGGVTVTR